MNAARAIGFLVALGAAAAAAQEPQARMQELHQVINDPTSTAADRQLARDELAKLLKSPAGQARGAAPGEKPVRARAAIEPLAPIVKPAQSPAIAVPPVAHVEVTAPPKTLASPHGNVAAPANGFAIDPRTGHVLHETPNGYVDPRTGQFTPK
jgi:hypothetical protein